jgi:hypothetical protein
MNEVENFDEVILELDHLIRSNPTDQKKINGEIKKTQELMNNLIKENDVLKAEYAVLLHKAEKSLSDHKNDLKQLENDHKHLVAEIVHLRGIRKQSSPIESPVSMIIHQEKNVQSSLPEQKFEIERLVETKII